MSTASNRMPNRTIEASSSRERMARCSGVSARSSPATESSSSAMTWGLDSVPVTSTSGSMTRRSGEGLAGLVDDDVDHWRETLIFTLVSAVDRHPLARRVLAGLEPEITVRLLTIPALEQLRKASCERIRAQQLAGDVRADVDPDQ